MDSRWIRADIVKLVAGLGEDGSCRYGSKTTDELCRCGGVSRACRNTRRVGGLHLQRAWQRADIAHARVGKYLGNLGDTQRPGVPAAGQRFHRRITVGKKL